LVIAQNSGNQRSILKNLVGWTPDRRQYAVRLTNRWNRFIYRVWSPIYDGLFDRAFAAPGRRQAMRMLDLQPGESVLLAGIGTGADLPLMPDGVQVVGVDLSPEMLAQAAAKQPMVDLDMILVQGDAQALPLAMEQFDAALLNLVLSVVPDGSACLRETLRALRPDGRIVIFDKFLPDAAAPSLLRRLLNMVTTLIGTDITRRVCDIISDGRCTVVRDEPSLMRGAYRVIEVQPDALISTIKG
jgi:phosphatidylethanolamine/phosphatidyl-N-methylethanolamine N-methyltransferase